MRHIPSLSSNLLYRHLYKYTYTYFTYVYTWERKFLDSYSILYSLIYKEMKIKNLPSL